WQYDLRRAQALLYAPSVGGALDRAGGTALRVVSGVVYGLWHRAQGARASRACQWLWTPLQCPDWGAGRDLRQRPAAGQKLCRLGGAGAQQLGGHPEGP